MGIKPGEPVVGTVGGKLQDVVELLFGRCLKHTGCKVDVGRKSIGAKTHSQDANVLGSNPARNVPNHLDTTMQSWPCPLRTG